MGAIGSVRGCGSAGEVPRPGLTRAFERPPIEPFIALWQTVTGLFWLTGRIAFALARYYTRAVITPLARGRRPHDDRAV
jgi:hypothetical protein